MFKKPTKKQMLIRRIIFSILATISVIIIVTVAILFMLGYRLDSGNGNLRQGALLQFNSTPGAAQVWINDRYIGSQTATKQTVVAGVHSIKFTKEGYEDWNRTLDLEAGTLTWLDYARLVPKERPVEAVKTYENLVSMDFSPDRRFALAHQQADAPRFDLVDLRSEEVKTTNLTLEPELYSEASSPDVPHSFSVHQWSSGGRYVILKHTFANDLVEWLLLDTQEVGRSVNITRSLSVELKDVKFASNSGMGLYGLTDTDVLRKLDVSGGTLSRGLVTHVERFNIFEESSVVSYIGTDPDDDTTTVAGIYRDGDSVPHILRSVSEPNASLHIAVGRYFNEDYIALSEGTAVSVSVGRLPSGSGQNDTMRSFASISTNEPVTALSFSPGGNYVLAQSGATFTSYELEHERASIGSVQVADGQDVPRLQWLDGAHVWSNVDGSVVMRDFDGTNVHSIMSSASGFDASLSQNGRFFYAVGNGSDQTLQLQRIRMILE